MEFCIGDTKFIPVESREVSADFGTEITQLLYPNPTKETETKTDLKMNRPNEVLHYPYRRAILVIGLDAKSDIVIYVYRLDLGEWAGMYTVKLPFRRYLASTFAKRLYVIGSGFPPSSKNVKCCVYDMRQNDSFEGDGLNLPRSHAGMVSDAKFVYVAGGLDMRGNPTRKVEMMHVRDIPQRWIELPDMKNEHWLPGIVVNKSSDIFVFGGFTNSCECYLRSHKLWFELPSLPERYRDFAVVSVIGDNGIYSLKRVNPRELCLYTNKNNKIEVFPIGGNFPKEIIAILFHEGNIWALADSNDFCVLSLSKFQWKHTLVKIPEDMKTICNAHDVLLEHTGVPIKSDLPDRTSSYYFRSVMNSVMNSAMK